MGAHEVTVIIGNALVIITFLASTGFVVLYHLSARWWETDFGKSLMTYQVAMTIVLGLAVPRIFDWDEHAAFQYVRVAVFTFVPVALIWRIVVLARIQVKARKEGSNDR